MATITFHGFQESLDHIADRIKHHRSRRDSDLKLRHLLTPRALIVDDDVESIQPLQIVLHNFGFETTLAFDGRESFRRNFEKEFPTLFFSTFACLK